MPVFFPSWSFALASVSSRSQFACFVPPTTRIISFPPSRILAQASLHLRSALAQSRLPAGGEQKKGNRHGLFASCLGRQLALLLTSVGLFTLGPVRLTLCASGTRLHDTGTGAHDMETLFYMRAAVGVTKKQTRREGAPGLAPAVGSTCLPACLPSAMFFAQFGNVAPFSLRFGAQRSWRIDVATACSHMPFWGLLITQRVSQSRVKRTLGFFLVSQRALRRRLTGCS